jgi:4-hydroxy-tetrahydrodipicolinate synthase
MNLDRIRGSMPALITPFRNGTLDERAFTELVEWQIAEGSHGLVPVGTTGESPTLTPEEHARVIELCVKTAAGRVPVIAGAGSNSTAEAIQYLRHAESVGADAALVVSPYYNKPNQEGLYQHYKALSEATHLPIIVYNIPGRSIVDILPETMGRIAKLANVVGVKDATANLTRVDLQRIHCGKEFIQLSGEDGTALGFNAHGGRGCISVTANIAPKLCAQFQEATLLGDYKQGREIQEKLFPLHRALFLEPSPAPVKFAAAELGLCAADVRLPLVGISEATKDEVRAALKHAGLKPRG